MTDLLPGYPKSSLEAVNELLRAISLREVADVNDTIDSYNALKNLSRANYLIQARGWQCNTFRSLTFTRNPGPTPPLNTVSIDTTVYLLVRPSRGGNVWPKDLTVIGGLLYDKQNNTNVLDVDPALDVIKMTDFGDLPPALRWYIIAYAGLYYMPETYPTPELYRFTQDTLDSASSEAAHEDELLRDKALYETSPHFRGFRQR